MPKTAKPKRHSNHAGTVYEHRSSGRRCTELQLGQEAVAEVGFGELEAEDGQETSR